MITIKTLLNMFIVAMFFCLTVSTATAYEANESNLKDKVEGIAVTETEVEALDASPVSYTVKLSSGWVTPSPGVQVDEPLLASKMADTNYVYCLIQFYHGKYTLDNFNYIKKSGIEVLSYVPENTYYAKVPSSWLDTPPSFVRWIGTLKPEQKIDPAVKHYIDLGSNKPINVTILLFESLTESQFAIVKQSSETIKDVGETSISVEINPSKVINIASLNSCKWIYKFQKPKLTLDRSTQLISANRVWANGNIGSGVTVGVIDSGIQHNHDHFSTVTIYDAHDYADGDDYPEAECGEFDCSDYSNNDNDWVIYPDGSRSPKIDEGTHGVHVAGIVAGSSTYDGRNLNGVSNGANLVVERVFDEENVWCAVDPSNEDIWREILDPDGDNDLTEENSADIISNSWGHGDGEYDASSRMVDRVVRGELGKETIVVMAAGNDGTGADVDAPGTAKNAITVGACADFRDGDSSVARRYDTDGDGIYETSHDTFYDGQNEYAMDYSSRGTNDMRVKPDILAPGSAITSSVLGNSYISWDGTSMATPHVAAVAAQILHEYPSASPALIKAFIISSAVDGGTTDATSIDRAWGRLNAHSSAYQLPDEAVDSYDEDTVGNLLSLQPKERYYTIDIPDDATKLIVTLVYSDDPGDPTGNQAEPKLVNDLDLFLNDSNGNELYRNDDAVNNVEKYVIDNPTAGNWEAHVRAIELADWGGILPKSQDYAIAMIVIKETEEPSMPITPHHNVTLCTSTSDSITVAEGDSFEVWSEVSCKGLSGYNVFCNVTGTTPGLTLLSDEFDGSGEEYDLLGDISVSTSRLSRHWVYRADTVGKYQINISAYGERAGDSEISNSTNITVNVVTKQSFSIEKGLCYLRTTQQGTQDPSDGDGSWSSDIGVTSLAALSFMNAGYNETDPDVRDAIGYIRSKVQGDGSITSGSKTYHTSLATLALVATYNDSYNTTIDDAAQWLKNSQWDESCLWGSVNTDSWYYGGFGYGYHVRPDNSNTQFALMALDAVQSIPKDDPLWDKAQIFLNRTQARDESNDQPWANGRNSSGFIYTPNGGTAGGGSINGYGSMTGAGIWGMRLSNVEKDDPRVEAAVDWVTNNYMWDGNPGMSNTGYGQYYYYLSMSKALTMINDSIGGQDWYQDLSNNLTALQKPEGYWINDRSNWAWEDNKDLVTSYAILSLQTRADIPDDIKRLSYLTFILHSNADLHIYDPLGRHVGMNYETGEVEIGIPGATYSINGNEEIHIPCLEAGNYRIELVGTGYGEYTLEVTGGVGDTIVSQDSFTSTITSGEVHDGNVNVAMITGLTIHIEGPEPGETHATIKKDFRYADVNFNEEPANLGDLLLDPNDNGKYNVSYVLGKKDYNVTSTNPGQLCGVINITGAGVTNISINDTFGSQFDVNPEKLGGGVEVIRLNSTTGNAMVLTDTANISSAEVSNDMNRVKLIINLTEPLRPNEHLMIYVKFGTALKHKMPDYSDFINQAEVYVDNGGLLAAQATIEFE